jgi:hypothetical protein
MCILTEGSTFPKYASHSTGLIGLDGGFLLNTDRLSLTVTKHLELWGTCFPEGKQPDSLLTICR